MISACGGEQRAAPSTPIAAPPTQAAEATPEAPVLFGTPPPFMATSASATPEGNAARRKLKLVVMGAFRDELVPTLADSLARAWDLEVETLPAIELPAAAYYKPRKRYRADKLAEHLETLLGDNGEGALILGLTDKDVSTTKGDVRDWGVIGLAYLGGPSGVLSLHRIVKSARDDEHVRRRVEIVAAHEVGHMIGLPHCEEQGCFMRDAEGTLDNVDEATGQLGPLCQSALSSLPTTDTAPASAAPTAPAPAAPPP